MENNYFRKLLDDITYIVNTYEQINTFLDLSDKNRVLKLKYKVDTYEQINTFFDLSFNNSVKD